MKRARQERGISMRLYESEKQSLIEIVEKFPELWNEEDQRYKDIHARADAWKAVSEEMTIDYGKDYDVELLQKSFKNLKDVYLRKRKQCREALRLSSGAEGGVVEKIRSWIFFKPLSYLDPRMDTGIRYSNAVVNEEDESGSQAQAVDSSATNSESLPSSQGSVNPISALGKRRERRAPKPNGAMEDLVEVLRSGCSEPDRFEAMGQLLVTNLRELNTTAPLEADDFLLKLQEIALEIAHRIRQRKVLEASY